MAYRGAAPAEFEMPDKLQPGWHSVRITKVVELRSGDYLAVLENQNGEAPEWIPDDIRPPASKEERRGNSAFRFWRLVGGFDYPSAEYWNTPADEREAIEWPVKEVLEEIKDRGTWATIQVSEWEDRDGNVRPSVEQVLSPVRKTDLIPHEVPLGGSVLDDRPDTPTQEKIPGTEVPF